MKLYDIAIAGGGAAGLAAAAYALAVEKKLQIAILEKSPRVGKKLLVTGNGRCNLGNLDMSAVHFHGETSNAEKIISVFEGSENFFHRFGLFCRADSEGRLYPMSNSASSVLDALRLACSDADEICNFDIKSIEKKTDCFVIQSDNAEVRARRVIAALGGGKAELFGGHAHTPLLPSLAPLPVSFPELSLLNGIRCKACVSLELDGKTVRTEYGELQFGKNNVSGICVFNLSSEIRNESFNGALAVDFLPDMEFTDIVEMLRTAWRVRKKAASSDLLSGIVHKRIGQCILRLCEISEAESVEKLTERQLRLVASRLKKLRIPLSGKLSWNSAQVTKGGISLTELDDGLQSRRMSGLYFCGEMLNVDGDCGGYNLTWAWASACRAVSSVLSEYERGARKK